MCVLVIFQESRFSKNIAFFYIPLSCMDTFYIRLSCMDDPSHTSFLHGRPLTYAFLAWTLVIFVFLAWTQSVESIYIFIHRTKTTCPNDTIFLQDVRMNVCFVAYTVTHFSQKRTYVSLALRGPNVTYVSLAWKGPNVTYVSLALRGRYTSII